MDIFKELHKAMDDFSENIAKEVADKRMYEVDKIKAIAKTRLWFAIKECLMLQVSNLEIKRRKLVDEYVNPLVTNYTKLRVQKQLAYITAQKKDANRLLYTFQDYDEYKQLKNYVIEKFGQESFVDFYTNYLNREENRKNKTIKN